MPIKKSLANIARRGTHETFQNIVWEDEAKNGYGQFVTLALSCTISQVGIPLDVDQFLIDNSDTNEATPIVVN